MRQPQSAASSLITTLLVIVILSTIVVAFMQSMSIDRLTARSAKNILQAELAARAGLDSAIAQILAAIGTNRAFVTDKITSHL
jgi:type II secretory pathway component PulK